jgi:TolB-like protein/DNA-binding winged helix-turn-helix (wHTH) protein
MSQSTRLQFRFGEFCLDVDERCLLHRGVSVPLAPKVFDTLLLLVKNAGHLIEKEEFMKELWPDTFVGDDALARNISILRKVLGESSESQSAIATVPKKGYRFVAEVSQNGTQTQDFQTADLWDIARAVEELPAAPSFGPAAPNVGEAAAPRVLSPVPVSVSPWRGIPFVLFTLALGFLAGLLTFYLLHPASFLSRRVFGMNPTPSIHSIAVLPLQNLSADPAQEYFSDGMTDALITDLAEVSSLRVISRTSTIRYKKSGKSLPQIARELHVDGIVEGTVLRSGNRVRINAQLIEASSDRHLWAKSYEGDLQDAFSLQSEIARSIAQQIRVKLTPGEEQVLIHARPVNLNAIEPYLRGQYHLTTARSVIQNSASKQGREAEAQNAISEFQRAIAVDPDYAPAYVAMASTLVMKGGLSPSDSREAREAIQKALSIDPDSAEAHMILGRLDLFDWNWDAAGREYRRAVELGPNLADAHGYYAEYLDITGHPDEGFHEAEIAKGLDPASDRIAWEFYVRRHFDRFIESKRNDIASHMFGPMAHYDLGYGYERAGMREAAVQEWEEAMAGFGFEDQAEALRRGYASDAFPGAIRQWVAAQERLAASGQAVYPELPAYLYAILGDKDRAFAWLEKAYQQRTHGMPFLKEDPTWDDIRFDPRFADLERRVGIP